MDHSLPFSFFTLNERLRGEDDYASFDKCPQIDDDVEPPHHPLHLHRLRINQREVGSNFCSRENLSTYRGSNQQRLHRPVLGQPPVPHHMEMTQ